MSKRTYQLIALLSAPLPIAGAYLLGRPIAGWLSSLDDEISTMLSLLGYVLGLLGAVILWGVVLAPLRAKAGFTPIGQDLAQIRQEGFANAIAREQAALKERERSDDPVTRAEHHGLMALVGALFSVAAIAMTWALWEDGYVVVLPAAAALACPGLTVYHLVQRVRFQRVRA